MRKPFDRAKGDQENSNRISLKGGRQKRGGGRKRRADKNGKIHARSIGWRKEVMAGSPLHAEGGPPKGIEAPEAFLPAALERPNAQLIA